MGAVVKTTWSYPCVIHFVISPRFSPNIGQDSHLAHGSGVYAPAIEMVTSSHAFGFNVGAVLTRDALPYASLRVAWVNGDNGDAG